jgi:hypothetical protein
MQLPADPPEVAHPQDAAVVAALVQGEETILK